MKNPKNKYLNAKQYQNPKLQILKTRKENKIRRVK